MFSDEHFEGAQSVVVWRRRKGWGTPPVAPSFLVARLVPFLGQKNLRWKPKDFVSLQVESVSFLPTQQLGCAFMP